MRTFYWQLIAILAIVCPQVAQAALQSPIAPGDIIFQERFEGWYKFDPATEQFSEITQWNEAVAPSPSNFAKSIAFDVDGAILYNTANVIFRLNPWTGELTSVLSYPSASSPSGFVVEPNGDLLLAIEAEGISRFSRATKTITNLIPARRGFWPQGITSSPDGRIFVTDPTFDILEVDLQSGMSTPVTTTNFFSTEKIASHPNGQLLIQSGAQHYGLFLVDPDTGDTQLFSDAFYPTGQGAFAFDAVGALWQSSSLLGIYKYSSSGGNPTLYTDASFPLPRAITVVPLNWTPPPVPEPAGIALLTTAMSGLFVCRRSSRTCCLPVRCLS
jgi:hypothetical protein